MRKSTYIIEVLSPSDEQLFAQFVKRFPKQTVNFFHPHPFTRSFLAKICQLSDRQFHLRLVVKYQQKIVAYAFVTILPWQKTVGYFGIAVDSQMRGKGLGELLTKAIFKHATKRGVRSIHLNVVNSNAGAIHLYEKLGFHQLPTPFLISKGITLYELYYADEIGTLIQDKIRHLFSEATPEKNHSSNETSLWMVKDLSLSLSNPPKK